MKIINANKNFFNPDNVDIAIVGAGIIGIFFAFLLKKSKLKVILIDRGTYSSPPKEKRTILNGIYHSASQSTKGFRLGGNSSLWGGQLSEFRKEDIKKNFWGLNYSQLKKLYNEVYKILHLKCNNKILVDKKFKIGFYFTYFLKEPNLYKYFKSKLLNYKNILIISNLVAQELVFKDKQVVSLKCKSNKNKLINIKAKKFVFCLGTIENIRFFLTNKISSGSNPLKKLRLIGHYFQDHIEVIFGRLIIKSEKKFSNLFENRLVGNLIHQPKICNVIDDKNQLSMFSSFLSESHNDKLANKSKKNLKDFKNNFSLKNFIKLFKFSNLKYTILYIFHYIRFKKIKLTFGNSVKMNVISEQTSSFKNKVTINNKKLNDGLNQVVLHWGINHQEFDQFKIFMKRLNVFFSQSGAGELKINKNIFKREEFIKNIKDTNHASGGLKISKNSKNGVCDKNFKVWGTTNLYILGSALFPNSGHSNVTLTAMAFALKLSKEIKFNK
jgi:hypothetical protein